MSPRPSIRVPSPSPLAQGGELSRPRAGFFLGWFREIDSATREASAARRTKNEQIIFLTVGKLFGDGAVEEGCHVTVVRLVIRFAPLIRVVWEDLNGRHVLHMRPPR